MFRQLTHSAATSYFLFALVLFAGLAFLQRDGNALPFFYKDYPTYPVNGEKHFDRNSENLVLNRIDFAARDIPYPYHFHLWRSGPKTGPAGYQIPARSRVGLLTRLFEVRYRLKKAARALATP
ncbi:hypothetical protein E0E54_07825 [Azotobacter chroococcum]|uniref:Uncharacterized protein n=1 Tax=Azotobacter chroococcum TaxID=353 RepID=A0AAQ0BX54_9GAMM|nr:hypothetical protein [Azotobacter chroococcum]QQE87178.1 hypothetical protein GKQ51_12685 [Azotobacter chroococcum]TBW37321.1 hypothetical protein E0E54_07825 [Azotobacter chroococcum]